MRYIYAKISDGSSSFHFPGDTHSTGFASPPEARFQNGVVVGVRISKEVRTKKEPFRGVRLEGAHMRALRKQQVGVPVTVSATPVEAELYGCHNTFLKPIIKGVWIFQSPDLEEGQWYLAVREDVLQALKRLVDAAAERPVTTG